MSLSQEHRLIYARLDESANSRRIKRLAAQDNPSTEPQRINNRAADVQAGNQSAIRAQNLLRQGVQTTKENEAFVRQELMTQAAGSYAGNTPQSLAQSLEFQQKLPSQQSGAGGQKGALGFNPEGQFSTTPGQPGNFSAQSQPTLQFGNDISKRLEEAGNKVNDARFQGRNPAETERSRTELMRQEQLKIDSENQQADREKQRGADEAMATAEAQQAQVSPELNPLQSILNSPDASPEQKLLASAVIADMQSKQQNEDFIAKGAEQQAQMLEGMKEDLKSTIADVAAAQKTTLDAVQEAAKEMKESNEKSLEEQRATEELRMQWEEDRLVRDAKDKERKAIESKVAQLALAGGFGNDGGLREIEEVSVEYEKYIGDIRMEMGLQRRELSTRFTALKSEINNNYLLSTSNNLKEYTASLERLALQGLSGRQSIAEAENSALQSFINNTVNTRNQTASSLKSGTQEMIGLLKEKRNEEFDREKVGYDRLNRAIGAYGQNIPQTIVDQVKKMLPGVDVDAIIQTPTLAQMKANRSGGGGGGGDYLTPEYYGPGAEQFSNVTPQQLREAVDRVTLSFGGTGSERNRKRGEYLGRIASGEPAASIMASLQSDFWVSQKGAEKTKHDERVAAQGSMEALQSFTDYYGTMEDDGPLGFFDSKVQGVASWFGQSSEEYNNLAGQVGNIRAKIIKDNYGAAVTPQELNIARSYIPSMSDKGQIFVTKLANLKSYNEYLDAKQFAVDAGLPPPQAPSPVSMSGNGLSGTSKYSPDDILSALQ